MNLDQITFASSLIFVPSSATSNYYLKRNKDNLLFFWSLFLFSAKMIVLTVKRWCFCSFFGGSKLEKGSCGPVSCLKKVWKTHFFNLISVLNKVFICHFLKKKINVLWCGPGCVIYYAIKNSLCILSFSCYLVSSCFNDSVVFMHQ